MVLDDYGQMVNSAAVTSNMVLSSDQLGSASDVAGAD